MNPYVAYENIIPLLAPADLTTNTGTSAYIDLKGVNRAAFLLVFGNIHSGTGSDVERVTVEACTDPAGTEAAIAYNYRLSGAVGDNTWSAITAATTAGADISITDDSKLMWIEVDPDALAANNYRYIRAVATPTDASQMANCVLGILGVIEPKYKMTTYVSATACASA